MSVGEVFLLFGAAGLFVLGLVFARITVLTWVVALVFVYWALDLDLWDWVRTLFWIFALVAAIVGVVTLFVLEVRRYGILLTVPLAAILAIGSVSWLVGHVGNEDNKSAKPPTTAAPTTVAVTSTTTRPIPTTSTVPPFCGDTWVIQNADTSNNRWFADGTQAIREAKTPQQAQDAAHIWLVQVKLDPAELAGAASYFLHRDVDPSTLVTGKCGSLEAKKLVTELELAIANAVVTPDQAPANGVNSGVSNGTVVVASTPGISGDRTAIKVVLKDGTTVWIMARCGNPVVTKPPAHVPPGPTDNTPPPSTTAPPSTSPPSTSPPLTQPPCVVDCVPTTKLKPKDPTQDPLVNPAVPPIVKGPGSTPPGGDPGKPTPPVDSPTGCNGPGGVCAQPPNTAAPVTTLPPSSGSGKSGDSSDLPKGGSTGGSNPQPALPSTTATLPPRQGDTGVF